MVDVTLASAETRSRCDDLTLLQIPLGGWFPEPTAVVVLGVIYGLCYLLNSFDRSLFAILLLFLWASTSLGFTACRVVIIDQLFDSCINTFAILIFNDLCWLFLIALFDVVNRKDSSLQFIDFFAVVSIIAVPISAIAVYAIRSDHAAAPLVLVVSLCLHVLVLLLFNAHLIIVIQYCLRCNIVLLCTLLFRISNTALFTLIGIV